MRHAAAGRRFVVGTHCRLSTSAGASQGEDGGRRMVLLDQLTCRMVFCKGVYDLPCFLLMVDPWFVLDFDFVWGKLQLRLAKVSLWKSLSILATKWFACHAKRAAFGDFGSQVSTGRNGVVLVLERWYFCKQLWDAPLETSSPRMFEWRHGVTRSRLWGP